MFKRLTLLVGAVTGATAAYVFRNKKLRDQFKKTKDTRDAAKIVGQHLKHDVKELAKQAYDLWESEQVQTGLKKAKKYANTALHDAKDGIDHLIQQGAVRMKQSSKKLSSAKKAKKSSTTQKSKKRVVASRSKVLSNKVVNKIPSVTKKSTKGVKRLPAQSPKAMKMSSSKKISSKTAKTLKSSVKKALKKK